MSLRQEVDQLWLAFYNKDDEFLWLEAPKGEFSEMTKDPLTLIKCSTNVDKFNLDKCPITL